MRIVQATITYPPAVGGVDRWVKEISESLVKRGNHVVVATTDLEQPFSRSLLTVPPSYPDLAEVHRLTTQRIPRIGFPFALGMKSVIRNSRADVIHAHCVAHSPTLLSWQVARQLRIPLVINAVYSPRSGAFWSRYLRFANRMMNDAACVIAMSEFEKRLLAEAGVSKDKVHVIPPVVDLATFKTPRPSPLEKFGLAGKRVIVSLSRLAFGKRVDRLIQALPGLLKKHPEARLMIIGPDYGDETRLRQITHSLKLDEFVVFTGSFEKEDSAAALQSATAFVMTTDFELFGITLIEAMAAGTPIVAANITAVPFVIRDGKTGLLFNHRSSQDLEAKLDLLLSDEGLSQRLIAAGRHEAATRFDFQNNMDRLEEIYDRARKSA